MGFRNPGDRQNKALGGISLEPGSKAERYTPVKMNSVAINGFHTVGLEVTTILGNDGADELANAEQKLVRGDHESSDLERRDLGDIGDERAWSETDTGSDEDRGTQPSPPIVRTDLRHRRGGEDDDGADHPLREIGRDVCGVWPMDLATGRNDVRLFGPHLHCGLTVRCADVAYGVDTCMELTTLTRSTRP
jgi:hypothetical protein